MTPPKRWWCQLGTMYALIEAPGKQLARTEAARVFRPRGATWRRINERDIDIRRATKADIARWDQLLEQTRRIG